MRIESDYSVLSDVEFKNVLSFTSLQFHGMVFIHKEVLDFPVLTLWNCSVNKSFD